MSPDLFLSFSNLPSNILLEAIYDDPNKLQPSDSSPSDILSNAHLFSSPPIPKQSLLLDPTILPQSPPTAVSSADWLADMSLLDMPGLKLDNFTSGFDSYLHSLYINNRRNEEARLAQGIFTSQSTDHGPSFLFQPHFSSHLNSTKLKTRVPNSSINSRFSGCLRRACSTGDLHTNSRNQSLSPSASGNSSIEEGSFPVARYSPEEKQHSIDRYRCKRTQRNFNKTIKYACRKTLADSRPRVRGRFTRNEDNREIPNAPSCHVDEENKEEIWMSKKFYSSVEFSGLYC